MKIKGRVKFTAVLMALSMAIIAGCGGGTATQAPEQKKTSSAGQTASSTSSEQPAAPAEAKREHMDISVAYFNIGKAFPDRNNDEFLKMLESKFNVTFKDRLISYSDYHEKFQLWSASGELPDVFSHDIINKEQYYSWIDQGIIRGLPEDLSKYPNVEQALNMDDTKTLRVDGKAYVIPRLTYRDTDTWAMERALIVRKDWMEALKLDTPSTQEEYMNMLTSFAKNDPDGNGLNDTVGVTFRSTAMITALASGAFPNALNGSWVKEDGKYIPYYASEKMYDVVEIMREMYKAGAIDPDFAIMKTNEGMEKFGQGKVGAISMQATPNALNQLKNAWNKYNEDTPFHEVIEILPVSWVSEDGNQYRYTNITWWSESYFSSNVSDEKMERILEIYDYLLSDDFKLVKQYGLEGADYKVKGDNIVITREKDENGNYVGLSGKYPSLHLFGALAAWGQEMEFMDNEVNRIAYGEELWKLSYDGLQDRLANHTPVPTNFGVQLLYTPLKASLGAFNATADLTRIMLAKEDPRAMWADTIKSYEAQGLWEAVEEVNAEIQKQGLDQ